MSQFMQPSIILLREGTDQSQGIGQLISNINACQAVGDVIRTTLGPRGMDKLVYEGAKATISNDGASILKLLDIVHPAAKSLVDIAKSQDSEVGDGTTSVTLIACELLTSCKSFLEDNVHSQHLITGFRKAALLATNRIKEIQVGVDSLGGDNAEAKRVLLERVAGTALNSKLICGYKKFFAPMCVDALYSLDQSNLDLSLVGIKKVTGGSVTDSHLVAGVAFKKTFSYAGFEQQPKYFDDPKVLLLNVELELKNEKENAEVRIEDPALYQSIVDAEWKIIYDKLDQCVATGAKIVLSKLPIGDLATQYFADRNMFCAGRVPDDDLKRVAVATGAEVLTTTNDIPEAAIGTCGVFQEKQIGGERFNYFTKCPGKASTIIIRGGSEQFVEESHRSLWDALMVVKRSMESSYVVAGGGAVEMELSRYLRAQALMIEGKQQLVILAFSKALEVIPRQLCDNAGLDSTEILNQLRQKHSQDPTGGLWYGVDVYNGGVGDMFNAHVWEPAANKLNSIAAATEAACLILSVDETVRNPQSEQAKLAKGGGRGRGGAPMSAAMGGQGLKGMGAAMGGGRGVRMMQGRGGK